MKPDLHLLTPRGFRAGAVAAKIKASGRPDVAMLVCDQLATASVVFTTNKVFAAPVKIGREHAAKGTLRGVIVNAGNANACTGKQGERDARTMCLVMANQIGCTPKEILPSSTGIIGHLLPMDKVELGVIGAADALGSSKAHALAFADAILTTDTKRKTAAAQFKLGKSTVTIAGVCKGSGMIGPRLAIGGAKHATMLAYLTTDAKITAPLLRTIFAGAADGSFNAVTVDDHTSTNDTAAILASGLGGATIDTPAAIKRFTAALNEVCQSLAYQIAADGEGATKVVKIIINGAATLSDAKLMARAIANSPLVKCAMHGNDPNWGRIVSAAGLCGAQFDPDLATLTLQGTRVFHRGRPLKFDAATVSNSLAVSEVVATLACGLGKFETTIWTCDLSKDYVTINADYHT